MQGPANFEIDRFISDRQVECDVFPSTGAQNWGQIQPDPSVHQSKSNVIYLGSDGPASGQAIAQVQCVHDGS
jgi:hypothetical protein